jgi:hypothetical protein
MMTSFVSNPSQFGFSKKQSIRFETLPAQFNNLKVSFIKETPGQGVEAGEIKKYAIENILASNPEHTGLRLIHEIESPYGRHFTFQQTYLETPIYGSQLKVNLDLSGNITSTFNNTFSTKNWGSNNLQLAIKDFHEAKVSKDFSNKKFDDSRNADYSKMIFPFNEEGLPKVVLRIEFWDNTNHNLNEYLVDNEGTVIFKKDLCSYHAPANPCSETSPHNPGSSKKSPRQISSRALIQDSTASAYVFLPDPLTTAGVNYGGAYIDNDDADIAELNDERTQVTLAVTFENDSFHLENQYVKIVEASSPIVPPAVSATPDFDFTRTEQGFEEVNVFYHITAFKQHLNNLGFHALADFQIQADVHALGGDDNSLFVPGNPPGLRFGEGGVDDAEDADVIVHEYGHALTYSAAPNTNSGFDRQALDEGFGDYVAASYSRGLSNFRWGEVFTWDGHNEYWGGRNANTNKHYPDDLDFSIHSSGEIWSSALMEIWGVLGRFVTDKIVFQSIYSYSTNMTMHDAACLLVQADTLIYNGLNSSVIIDILDSRGLWNKPTAIIENLQAHDIKFYNTESFAIGEGNIFIELPSNHAGGQVEVFNQNGGLIYSAKINRSPSFELVLGEVKSGLYFVRVATDNLTVVTEVVRLR